MLMAVTDILMAVLAKAIASLQLTPSPFLLKAAA